MKEVKEITVIKALKQKDITGFVSVVFRRIFNDGSWEESVYGLETSNPNSTELSGKLWEQIQEKNITIEEYIPPPPPGERPEIVRQNLLARADKEIANLEKTRFVMKGESDSGFEAKRRRAVKDWFDFSEAVEKMSDEELYKEFDYPEVILN